MKKSIVFVIGLALSGLAQADVYKFVDANGRVTFSDVPQNQLYKKIHILSPYRKKLKQAGYGGYASYNPLSLSPYRANATHSPYRFKDRGVRGGYPTFFSNGRSFAGFNQNKNKFSGVIANAAYRNHVDERLVHAVIQTESAYNPSAVSRAGAVGLMQLMPGTARRYGVTNRSDPEQNVDGGTKYLKDLLGMFNYNLGLAVAAYNAGEGAVMKYNNRIPPYPETQNYVKQVLARYNNVF